MNHDHLRLLIEIAQQGSFLGVAKSRDLDPSSVSRIAHGVERELGVRLFQGSTRHVSLTKAGSAYLERVSHLLDELDSASDALKSLADHPSGVLQMSASVALVQIRLLPLIPEFTRHNLKRFIIDNSLSILHKDCSWRMIRLARILSLPNYC